MDNDKLFKIISEHFLSIRRIPLETFSVYEGHHKDKYPEGEIIYRDVLRKIDGRLQKVKAEYVRVKTIPENAGFWMCQSLKNNTNSIVKWSKKEHHLAESLEKSVQLFLDKLN